VQQSSDIPHAARGQSLIDFLSGRFRYLGREAWLERLAEGRLSLDGRPAAAGAVLAGGENLLYEMPDFAEPPANLDWQLLFEDDWILAAGKPGNLLVHHQGLSFTSNLVHLVRHAGHPDWAAADPIHRLDKETSGLVLFAKTKEALRAFQDLFMGGGMEKEYLAVVEAAPGAVLPEPGDAGTIDLPIGPLPDGTNAARQGTGGPGAKPASSAWRCTSAADPRRRAMAVFPRTGRTHQIRVHLAALGWPILGDKLYQLAPADYAAWIAGGKRPDDPLLAWPRQALHCRRLAFIHPFTGQAMELCAPLPPDMSGLPLPTG
jgi:RluA family pseudouridine synthase